jgi:ATP-binding protein involved in chromosome partitioning
MTTEEAVRNAIEEIRPLLQADGGDLELVAIEGHTVRVRLKGACSSCASATSTLRNVVEEKIRERCPEIERVVAADGERSAAQRADHDPFAAQQPLRGVGSIVAVASGKGGVGKSTVAVNVALALQKLGRTVGLLDADVYGPSLPTMLGTTDVPTPGPDGIDPVVSHGLRVMSIGFYLDPNTPVIWRGPMVMKALGQFLHDVRWGKLDCLVIDLPPGTGDAQLTVVQAVPVTGALVVTTPSDVALLDARRAIGMFEKVGVPIIGITENMSSFVCPHCGGHTDVFSSGSTETVAREMKVPLLGGIPLDAAICRGSDQGKPVVLEAPDSPQAQAFVRVAERVAGFLDAAAALKRAPVH